MTPKALAEHTVAELRSRLKDEGLPVSGVKAQLVERLERRRAKSISGSATGSNEPVARQRKRRSLLDAALQETPAGTKVDWTTVMGGKASRRMSELSTRSSNGTLNSSEEVGQRLHKLVPAHEPNALGVNSEGSRMFSMASFRRVKSGIRLVREVTPMGWLLVACVCTILQAASYYNALSISKDVIDHLALSVGPNSLLINKQVWGDRMKSLMVSSLAAYTIPVLVGLFLNRGSNELGMRLVQLVHRRAIQHYSHMDLGTVSATAKVLLFTEQH